MRAAGLESINLVSLQAFKNIPQGCGHMPRSDSDHACLPDKIGNSKIGESALQTMSRDSGWGDGHGKGWITGTSEGQTGSESRHVLKLSKQTH